MYKTRQAFTMIELVFVIAVIGILSAIAVPKFAASRTDAEITKAKLTVASVRVAIMSEVQARILKGDFVNAVNSLNTAGFAFSTFNADRDGDTNDVLQYPIEDCNALGETHGCWSVAGVVYSYNSPIQDNISADFNITNGRFDCAVTDTYAGKLCQELTR